VCVSKGDEEAQRSVRPPSGGLGGNDNVQISRATRFNNETAGTHPRSYLLDTVPVGTQHEACFNDIEGRRET
jgi:hypothetical protein